MTQTSRRQARTCSATSSSRFAGPGTRLAQPTATPARQVISAYPSLLAYDVAEHLRWGLWYMQDPNSLQRPVAVAVRRLPQLLTCCPHTLPSRPLYNFLHEALAITSEQFAGVLLRRPSLVRARAQAPCRPQPPGMPAEPLPALGGTAIAAEELTVGPSSISSGARCRADDPCPGPC